MPRPPKNITPGDDAPLFESVMEKVEDYFRSKRLRPGSKLPTERELAATFGVSRHTLREVLKALNLFGIIRSRAGDGTYVQRSFVKLMSKAIQLSSLLDDVDFLDLLEARMTIEPALARIAANKVRRDHLDLLRREIQAMELNLGKLEGYVEHEIAFHNLIIAAADSPVLRSVMDAIGGLLMKARLTITSEGINRDNLAVHVRILEAIEARDPEGAYQAMAYHLSVNRKYYEAYHRRESRKGTQ